MESTDSAYSAYEDALLAEHGFRASKKSREPDWPEVESEEAEVSRLMSAGDLRGGSITLASPHYLLEDESLSDLYDRMQRRKQNRSQAYDRYLAKEAARSYDVTYQSESTVTKAGSQRISSGTPRREPVRKTIKKNIQDKPKVITSRPGRIQRSLSKLVALGLCVAVISGGGVIVTRNESFSESQAAKVAEYQGRLYEARVDYANSDHDAKLARDFWLGAVGGGILALTCLVGSYAEEIKRYRRFNNRSN